MKSIGVETGANLAGIVKVLFVCTGNTCRSPMAEGIFRRLIMEHDQQEHLFCQSAGLSAVAGMPISENAGLVCAEIDVDLRTHKARRLRTEDMTAWDLYFTMSSTHGYILEKAGVPVNKVHIPAYISDPFGKDLAEYRKCREKLEKEVKIFYNTVVQPLLEARMVNGMAESALGNHGFAKDFCAAGKMQQGFFPNRNP